MTEFNSFMRASQIKSSQTPKKNRPSDADADADAAMMADIQCGIQFFNDEKLTTSADKKESDRCAAKQAAPDLDQSFLTHGQNPMNMSFSFAVEAPIEMEQKHKLIGQGWKKVSDSQGTKVVPPAQHGRKREAKVSDKTNI